MPEGDLPNLQSLPPEMVQNILEFVAPDDLTRIRDVSSDLRSNVDVFVTHLEDSGELRDAKTGLKATEGPEEALAKWTHGTLARSVPKKPFVEVLEATIARMNAFPSGRYSIQRTIALLIKASQRTDLPGLEVREQLPKYVEGLLAAGRLKYMNGDSASLKGLGRAENALSMWLDGALFWSK